MKIAPHIQERLAQAGIEWVRLRVEEYMGRLALEAEGLAAGRGYQWVHEPKEQAIEWLTSGGMDEYEAHQLFHELFCGHAGFLVSLYE